MLHGRKLSAEAPYNTFQLMSAQCTYVAMVLCQIRIFHVVVIYIHAPVDKLVSGMVLAETMNPVSRWVSNLDSNKACGTD